MSGLDHTFKPDGPLSRVEVIKGEGNRRRWLAGVKARMVDASLSPGAVVSEVARRHGISPQQLLGWRRVARRPAIKADPLSFVPAIVTPPSSTPPSQARARRGRRQSRANGIELEIGGVAVRVGADASLKSIAAVIG